MPRLGAGYKPRDGAAAHRDHGRIDTMLADQYPTLRILKAHAVAYETSVNNVTGSGSTSEIRLNLPYRQTILLDLWAGDDGDLRRSALRRR